MSRTHHNIERVLCDVQDMLAALEDDKGLIDVAYARWVFCFLSRPEEVVKALAALVKPGGRVAVQDYFNYERCLTLAPRREAFTKVIPIAQIVTAGLFDPESYIRFNTERNSLGTSGDLRASEVEQK